MTVHSKTEDVSEGKVYDGSPTEIDKAGTSETYNVQGDEGSNTKKIDD